jgi:RNA polymerase sigma-70 factor (ECF subfamily)
MSDESAELVAGWLDGDEGAASALFQRYAVRLIACVQAHWSEKLARHLDPEDVVQSAYRRSFSSVRDGRYLLEHSGDLWRLLVAVALKNVQYPVEDSTGKGAVSRGLSLDVARGMTPSNPALVAHDPSPAEVMAVADELEHVFHGLAPLECRMFLMRLEGFTLDEIAQQMHRSQRTVRRVMDRIKAYLEQCVREHVDR